MANLERWRGGVDEKLANLEASNARIEATLHEHGLQLTSALKEQNAKIATIDGRWTSLKTKIAVISAGAGVVAAAATDVAVRKLFGG